MRRLPTPGGVYFDDCPMGLLYRKAGTPFAGTASYARSWAPAPLMSGAQTSQTSADPDVVPSDVTTGELDEIPKASVDVPASESAGLPVPSRPYFRTRRLPALPPAVLPGEALGMYRYPPSPGHTATFDQKPP